jgi:DNA-binding transcriptional ArsR family regulator
MEDETEPLILDDPGRLKALSHPLRRQILHQLNTRGPATSTTIGAALGANTGTTSYHLRRLEMYGFIEEIPERSAGRERWWRRTKGHRDLRMPEPEKLAAEDRVILTELLRIRHTEDMELLGRLPEAYTQDRAWTMLSRGLTHMTQEGLAEFVEAYLRLLRQHGHRSDDAPPGSRPVHIRLFTLPADEFPAPGSPHSSETSQDHPGGLLK